MKVFFIYPNLGGQLGFNYGVAYLSAVLKERGNETALLNLNEGYENPSDEEIVKRVKDFGADVVGFSVVTTQETTATRIAKILKEKAGVVTVAGGVHATMATDELLLSGAFDYVCPGEAEYSFAQLLERLSKNLPTEDIPGVWLLNGGRIIRNGVSPLPDLRTLPMKDYSILDFQRLTDLRGGWVGLLSGRGCPFRCSYCFNHRFVDIYRKHLGVTAGRVGYIRTHTPQQVLDEIQFILENFKRIKMFIFDDDIFTLDKGFLFEFLKGYMRMGSPIPFVANAHIRFFSSETASALSAAGCRIIKFGLESGSERIRRD
ncbi:MAG: B12-binding domain-containing radical SAM protein, partial [Planctomycetota bacterium]|nr:B12-binding domain-containing radical SAM protein [Planctomycetota bacterium]